MYTYHTFHDAIGIYVEPIEQLPSGGYSRGIKIATPDGEAEIVIFGKTPKSLEIEEKQ